MNACVSTKPLCATNLLLYGIITSSVQETEPYRTLRRIQKSNLDLRTASFKEEIAKPEFEAPHKPLM